MKILMSFAIALVLCTALTAHVQAQAVDTTITARVKGITCATDLNMIQTSIENLEGVNKCMVGKQGTTTRFDIQYNHHQLSWKEIYAAIENTGSCENPEERPYKVKGKK